MKLLQKSRPVSALFLAGTLILSLLSATFLSPAASASNINKTFNCYAKESVTIDVSPGDFISISPNCGNFFTGSFNTSILTLQSDSASGKFFTVSYSITPGTYVDAIDLYSAYHTKYTLRFVGSPTFYSSTSAIPNTTLGSTSSSLSVEIMNVGTGNLNFGASAVVLSGTNAADFAIVADNCSSQSVTPTGNCTVTYSFTPAATGSRTADMVFTDNAAGSPHTVVLTATGTAPTFSASIPAIPNTLYYQFSSTQTETITNTGTANLTFGANAVALSGTHTEDFGINGDNCSNQIVVPSGTCTVTYYFYPHGVGVRTLNMVFTDNAAGSPHTVVLTATAIASSFSSSTPAIPDTTVNQTSATQTETITNNGDANLTFGASAVVLSGTNAEDFAIVADNCSSQSIAPTGNCTVTYTFTPTATGFRTADMVFTDNDPDSPHTVVLTGTGLGLPTFSASTPAIPDTTLGSTSSTQTETITNNGDANLTFGASAVVLSGTNAGDFAIVADNCSSQSVTPSGNCTVTYTFTPTATSSRTADMVFTDNATGSPHTVVLTARGTAPNLVKSPPGSPDTNIGLTSTIQTKRITNTGTADLIFGANAVVLSGTHADDFAIVADNCSNQTLTAPDYCEVTYTFTPSALGTRTASLVFTDNAAGSPQSLSLDGIGIAALSNDNTLASATIKGQSATLGTPSIAPGAATPGTVTISGTQSTSSTASVFTKSDPLATVTRVVKYASGASTSQFGTDTQYLDSNTITNGDFFVIQVKSESSRYLYYVINVTVASTGPGFLASTPTIPNTYVGTNSSTQTVTITNSGTANLVYGRRAVVLNGTNSSDFAIVADNCSGRSIAATRTCTVSFRFSPTSTGSRTANLVFTDNATGSPHTVVLTGTGLAAPLTISRLSENESGVRGGGRLTITGTGFANSATVTIGDVTAVVLERSGTTKITVRIPAHARGLVSVVVTNPDLTSASIGGFRYR